MSLKETITGTSRTLTTYSPSQMKTEVILPTPAAGTITLQTRIAGGDWVDITSTPGAYYMETPDGKLEYSFNAVGVTGNSVVYLGP